MTVWVDRVAAPPAGARADPPSRVGRCDGAGDRRGGLLEPQLLPQAGAEVEFEGRLARTGLRQAAAVSVRSISALWMK